MSYIRNLPWGTPISGLNLGFSPVQPPVDRNPEKASITTQPLAVVSVMKLIPDEVDRSKIQVGDVFLIHESDEESPDKNRIWAQNLVQKIARDFGRRDLDVRHLHNTEDVADLDEIILILHQTGLSESEIRILTGISNLDVNSRIKVSLRE